MNKSNDGAGLALLLGGAALAVITALFLPVLHFRGTDKALLGLSAWQAVPVITMLKLALVGAAVAAAFLPRLRDWRILLTAAAILMLFVPALGALAAGVYPWSGLRADIMQISGSRTPWVDPGWGWVALAVAALMLAGALWQTGRAEPAAA